MAKKRKNGFTLAQLMQLVDGAYPSDEDLVMQIYLHQRRKPGNNDTHGDTLALFLVRELMDTFDPKASENAQLMEAIRVTRRAITELEAVNDELHRAFMKYTVKPYDTKGDA